MQQKISANGSRPTALVDSLRAQLVANAHAGIMPYCWRSQHPPADRIVLVNGFDAWVETPDGSFPISTQYYRNDIESPSGHIFLHSFTQDPWPTWRFTLSNRLTVVQELFVPDGRARRCVALAN